MLEIVYKDKHELLLYILKPTVLQFSRLKKQYLAFITAQKPRYDWTVLKIMGAVILLTFLSTGAMLHSERYDKTHPRLYWETTNQTLKLDPILTFGKEPELLTPATEKPYKAFTTLELHDDGILVLKPPTGSQSNYEFGSCTWFVASVMAVPVGWGNANTWDDRAAVMGFTVSTTPKINAIAASNAGYWGHVAWVVGVNGNQVLLREMNVVANNVIDERWVGVNNYVYIYL